MTHTSDLSLFQLIQMSTMPEGEKQGWMTLLPLMTEEEKTALQKTLEKEVSQITDAFLSVLAERHHS